MSLSVKINERVLLIILAKKDMTQKEFADKIGISKAHLYQLMTHIRNPAPATRTKIIESLFPKMPVDTSEHDAERTRQRRWNRLFKRVEK